MFNQSIQLAIVEAAVGLSMGALIDMTLPVAEGLRGFAHGGSAEMSHQAFEAAVQVGLNGVAIAAASRLFANDPSSGFLFSMALFRAQGNLLFRVDELSLLIKYWVHTGAQRMGQRILGEPSTN